MKSPHKGVYVSVAARQLQIHHRPRGHGENLLPMPPAMLLIPPPLAFLPRALLLGIHFFNHARIMVSILVYSIISGEPVLWTLLLSRVFLLVSSLIS
jgi:hypothetical protein